MKTILLSALALVVVISVAVSLVGGTIATWSDSETMMNNRIRTGSVDLLVAKCDADWANPGAFKDDTPHGVGLDPCFFFTSLVPGNYTCYSLLWNAGCIDAVAYLHIKNVSDNALSSHTIMSIWYDDDGRPGTPLEPVASGTIANLNCHEIMLGGLPAEAVHQLKLEVEYPGGCPGCGLSFDIAFQVVQLDGDGFAGFADSETSQNYFSVPTP